MTEKLSNIMNDNDEKSEIQEDHPEIWSSSTRFEDGERKIDFVLVTNVLKLRRDMDKLVNFMEKLVKNGIEFETSIGVENRNLIFIKLHVPEDVLKRFANTFHINLEMYSTRERVESHLIKYKIFHTVLTKPDKNNPIYHRAEHSISGEKPKHITSTERSLILSKLLHRATFSDKEHDRGTEKLIELGVLIAAYPIHDSSSKWPEKGPISDRQLLIKYWANMRCWYKNIPLNLIYKYYGSETAFYFAFYDYYIKMLIPAAILGVLIFIFNLASMYFVDANIMSEVCEEEGDLCPNCLEPRSCIFKPIKKYCEIARFSSLVDETPNVLYAILMSFWSTVFIELWKRKEMDLRFRWNLFHVESTTSIRLNYYDNTKHRKLSKVTGKLEPYVPTRVKIGYYMLTALVCLLMAFVASLLVLAVIIYRLFITQVIKSSNYTSLKNHTTLFTMTTSALLSFICIKIISPFYMSLAKYLTEKENPKTIVEYFNSVIYKAYLLSFINTYFPIFYLAFLRGSLYSHPGNKEQYEELYGIRSDVCPPTGCITGLTILLLFILVLKASVFRFISAVIIPYIKFLWKRTKKHFTTTVNNIPVYEQDLKLHRCGLLFLTQDYMELSIQYGLITFFVSALPLGPLLALIYNIFEHRLDAQKILKKFRRPIGRKMPGIAAWFNIFLVSTYLGTVTNAFVIAFTSEFVNRELYRNLQGNLVGYLNSTLSEFHIDDFPVNVTELLTPDQSDLKICYYRGDRYPYYHKEKYELDEFYWEKLSVKLAFVIFFGLIIWALTGICAAAIPDKPKEILQQLNEEQNIAKKIRFGILNKTMGEAGKSSKTIKKFKVD